MSRSRSTWNKIRAKRSKGRHEPPPALSWVTCPSTGKRGYATRGDARTAARQTVKGAELDTYQCRAGCGRWHVGHLPRDVAEGKRDRRDIRPPRSS